MKSFKIFYSLLIALIFVFSSCDKEDPVIPNEEELITTVTYTLTPTIGGDPIVLSFKDLDGDGGDNPEIIGGTLMANTEYSGVLELLDESESPQKNITTEIEEEGSDHQFFIQSSISDLSVIYADEDVDGNPIGLLNTLTTGSTASGTITIILRHEPNKTATGVSDGDISNAEGETDVEVIFPINVQ